MSDATDNRFYREPVTSKKVFTTVELMDAFDRQEYASDELWQRYSSHEPGDSERTLRRMLAFAYSGSFLYGDDGEMQDSRLPFPIDYVRDSVAEIENKIYQRGMWTLAKAQAECAPHEWDGFGVCRKCMKVAERPTVTKEV